MKTIYKSIFIALLCLFGYASQAHAQTDQNSGGTVDSPASTQSAFCAKVDKTTTELDQLLSDSEMHFLQGAAEQKQTLSQSRAESDSTLALARTTADSGYADEFETLMGEAKTKAEKKAVSIFEKTMTDAVAKRRATVDDAIKTYRKGIDGVIASRGVTYTTALQTLKSSVDTTLTEAHTDCIQTKGVGFQSQAVTAQKIETAHQDFKGSLAALYKSTENADTLALARDDAVSNADMEFQTTVQAAAVKLKSVLKD